MNKPANRFDDFINNNPKESFQIFLLLVCFIWQSPVSVLGGLIYLIAGKNFQVRWWILLGLGVLFSAESFAIYSYSVGEVSLRNFIANGFSVNKQVWSSLFHNDVWSAGQIMFLKEREYWLGLPLLLAGILHAIDLFKEDPHKNTLKALKRGEHPIDKKELSEKTIQSALKRIDENKHDGSVLGVSRYTGKPVVIPDHFINQVMLVLGTTGSGKTVTLQRVYKRAITKGYPLIIVDGKPTENNVRWIKKLAEKNQRKFYGFNCANYSAYDALADGGYTELKDKIISLKDEWASDYYKSIAEDYLQATFQVLLQLKLEFDLARVIDCLDFDVLLEMSRETNDESIIRRVGRLGKYKQEDITGLQAHLSLLVNSELGHYFSKSENRFSLKQAINEDAVVYFALPALRYPSFSKVLGKLVVNDIKAVIDRNENSAKCIFTIFDEFSVFAGDQVLNLVNMGRGKGVHAIFGTQGLADLNRVDKEFKAQILNCANTIVCHRLNDQDSAEAVAAWMGTKDSFSVTAQYDPKSIGVGLGSVTADKGYVVHPEEIKQGLKVGEAYLASKIADLSIVKVKVKC